MSTPTPSSPVVMTVPTNGVVVAKDEPMEPPKQPPMSFVVSSNHEEQETPEKIPLQPPPPTTRRGMMIQTLSLGATTPAPKAAPAVVVPPESFLVGGAAAAADTTTTMTPASAVKNNQKTDLAGGGQESSLLRLEKEVREHEKAKAEALRRVILLEEQVQTLKEKGNSTDQQQLYTLLQLADAEGEAAALQWAKGQVSGITPKALPRQVNVFFCFVFGWNMMCLCVSLENYFFNTYLLVS